MKRRLDDIQNGETPSDSLIPAKTRPGIGGDADTRPRIPSARLVWLFLVSSFAWGDELVPATGGARRLPAAPALLDYHAKYAVIVGINDYESLGQGIGNLVEEIRCHLEEIQEIRCQLEEIRCQFSILARKDEPTPDYALRPSEKMNRHRTTR